MTSKELKVELECYKTAVNPGLNIENISLAEFAIFLIYLEEFKLYENGLNISGNRIN